MNYLISILPYAHIIVVLLLMGLYLLRTLFIIRNSKKEVGKNLNGVTSIMTIALFATGITHAYLLKIPFSDSFVLTKIIGLLAFVMFGVLAFMPNRKKETALLLLLAAFTLFIGLIVASIMH